MALSQYDTKSPAERGLVVEFSDPRDPDKQVVDEKGRPLTITILGGDSQKVRAKARQSLDKAFEKIRKNKDPGGAKESEQEQIERLVAATIAWSDNWVIDDGEPPLPCTPENAQRLYSDARFPWIVETLQKKIDDRAAFFVARANS
jgi:hypothetical protein